jgi:hypothetical protein
MGREHGAEARNRTPVTVGARTSVDPGSDDGRRSARSSIGSASDLHPVAGALAAMRRQVGRDPGPDQHLDYQLDGIIGEGGMGVIYAAWQTALGRTVALKRMRGRRGSPRTARRFLGEAAITGRLDHPNIVPIHDLGVDQDGVPFYAMKRVSGHTWAERIARLTLDENLDILLRVADAIAYAHANGIVHRDIKPDNVMLGEFGEVLVTDWGLAATIEELRGAPPGAACGTPAYMAPEMAWADHRLIGPASDIYLLGATLYHILVGEAPHPGNTVYESLNAAAANRIEPPVPAGELGRIAGIAMSLSTIDRQGSVQEFQAAIRDYRTHAQSQALAELAATHLRAARQGGHADYARALIGFEHALGLWADNRDALAGAEEARRAYGESAYASGDLDLADSLLGQLPGYDDLRQRIAAKRLQRERERHRVRVLTRLSAALTALVVVVLFGGLWLAVMDKRLVLRASQERDEAEARLAHEETQRLRHQGRTWHPLTHEDFTSDPAPGTLQVVGGRWAIAGGVLTAIGPGRGLLQLGEAARGDVRLLFDLVRARPLTVYLGVALRDVPAGLEAGQAAVHLDREACRLTAGGRLLAQVALPEPVAGLSQHVHIEHDGDQVRVMVDGRELLRHTVPAPAASDDPRLVIAADAGTAIDNLRLDRIER